MFVNFLHFGFHDHTLLFRANLNGLTCHNSRDEDPDPVIFGPPDPDPVLFSTDPDPDPTCNNGL